VIEGCVEVPMSGTLRKSRLAAFCIRPCPKEFVFIWKVLPILYPPVNLATRGKSC